MNICILGSHLPPIRGGIETHVWELAKNLAGRGHAVYLVGHTEDSYKLPEYEEKCRVHIYRVGYFKGCRRLTRAINILRQIYRLHEEHNIDILHAHQVFPVGTTGAYIKKTRQIPLVITSHGAILNDSKSVMKGPFIRFAFRESAKIIAASRELAGVCISAGAVGADVCSMSNAVDIGRFNREINPCSIRERYGIKSEDIVVMTLRRLNPKTGVQYLVEVSPSLVRRVPDIKFLIVGDSPEGEDDLKKELIRRVKELELEDKFIFTGSIAQEDVPEYIAASDFAVFPSLAEATSIAALEVMACGKPVVASNVGGLPEIIKNGNNGILVDFDRDTSSYADYGLSAGSLKNLEDAVAEMAGNKKLRSEFGINARKAVEDNFSWDRYIDRVEMIYRDAG